MAQCAALGSMTDAPTPGATALHDDLNAYASAQSRLYEALADFQAEWLRHSLDSSRPHPILGEYGLSLCLLRPRNCNTCNLNLFHTDGGQLDTYLANATGIDILNATTELLGLDLLKTMAPGFKDHQPQPEPAPVVLPPTGVVVTPPEAKGLPNGTVIAGLPATPAPAADPETPAAEPRHTPGPFDPPDPEALNQQFEALDAINDQDPVLVRNIVQSFKARFEIGRISFAKAITTQERLDYLAELIATAAAARKEAPCP